MKHFEGTKFPSLHENGDFYSRDTHLWATPIFEDKEDLSPFFWFPIPPTTGPFRIDSCYTSMINGGSQQSWHFSAFTNDETHWTTPPSTCWMAILPKKTTSKTKCEAGFLVYSSAAILSQTATEITNAKSSSVFVSFLLSPNLLYRSWSFSVLTVVLPFSFFLS